MHALLLSAAIAFAIFLIHTFVGGRYIARPLLAAGDLAPIAKLTSYYCWHITTIVLLAMSLGLGWAAFSAERALVWFVFALASAFALLNLALALRHRLPPRLLPQWLMFALLALSIAPALGRG